MYCEYFCFLPSIGLHLICFNTKACLWTLTSIPPPLNVPCSLFVDCEIPFTKSPVSIALEEVILSILPKEASTQVSGKSSPFFKNALRVLAVDMRFLARFKSPVVVTLEEVHLVVGGSKCSCVQVAWDSGETFRYCLWVAWLHLLVDEFPVFVALEYIGGSSVFPSYGRVNVSRQTSPVCRDPFRIAGHHS